MYLDASQASEMDDKFKNLVKFYHEKVRWVVVASERLDEKQRIVVPALVELRSAFEHVMRCFGVIHGIVEKSVIEETGLSPYDYCKKNFDKAHGHLYRAAYDAYDVIALALTKKVEDILEGVPRSTLYAVIPEASEKVVKPFNIALELVTQAKIKKDIGGCEVEERQFVLYEEATNAIQDCHDFLIEKSRELREYQKDINNRIRMWQILTVAGFAVGVIGVVLTLCAWLRPVQ